MRSIRFAKRLVWPPAKDSLATLDISAPERIDLSSLPISIENSETIPTPPTQAVEMRQNCSPRGSASISFRMEAPVVVKPETLSKKAFTRVNSRP